MKVEANVLLKMIMQGSVVSQKDSVRRHFGMA